MNYFSTCFSKYSEIKKLSFTLLFYSFNFSALFLGVLFLLPSSMEAQTCNLITHNPYNDFNDSKPAGAATLWVNVHVKLSGELTVNGDYLEFYGGTITLSGITASWTSAPIPTGKIIADNTVSTPITSFDVASNTWTTKVPLSYSSSEMFISGGVITSTSGYTTGGGKQDILTGYLYSNKITSQQWFYGLAAYQPTFAYSNIAASGTVTAIQTNGLHSGVPTNQTSNLIAGGSGGGGSNYTGSFSSTDNFTACTGLPCGTPTANAGTPQTICAGTSATLSGSIGGGATTGTWSAPSGSFSNINSLSSTYTPSITSGSVTLTLTTDATTGCTPGTSMVVITVNPMPSVTAPSNQTVCNGASTTGITFTGSSVSGTTYN